MKRKLMAIMLAIVCMMSAVACGASDPQDTQTPSAAVSTSATDPSNSAEASKYGGVLHVAQSVFDYSVGIGTPYEVTGTETETAYQALFEKLWERGADGHIKLVLADSYTVSDDGLEYTFVLKQGIKFHDGSDFNADAVAWNYNKAAAAGVITGLVGAEVIDDYTVKLILDVANPFFLMNNESETSFFIASKVNEETIGQEAARTHPVGTGPFKFVSMEVGKSIVLTRNENYWRTDEDGNQLPYLDGLEITTISDPTVAAAALANGEIDVYSGTLQNLVENLEAYGIEQFRIERGNVPTNIRGIRFMANGRNAKLFTDQRLRKAVAYAIDGKAIAATFKDGSIEYTEQVALPGGADYIDNPTVYEYNPEKAKELLAEAGYADGFDIEINIDTTSLSQRLAELYQYYLGQVGINVKIMSYANAERNEIQDRDDTWDQLLISSSNMQGDSSMEWSTRSPSRAKWRNMLPFDTEPEMVELWNKVAECRTEEEAYKALAEYHAHNLDICAQYLFMYYYADVKYCTSNVELQLDKVGIRWLDSSVAYLIEK